MKILQDLDRFATVANLGLFKEDSRAHTELHIDGEGNLVNVVQRKAREKTIWIPDLPNRTNAEIRLDFFVENRLYAFFEGKDKNAKTKKVPEFVRKTYREIADRTQDPGALAVANYYEKGPPPLPDDLPKAQVRFVFYYQDTPVCTRSALEPVLDALSKARVGREGLHRPCQVTGNYSLCQTTPHANTKGLSDNTSGSSLVSFNGSSQDFGTYRNGQRFLNARMNPDLKWNAALGYLAQKQCLRLHANLSLLVWEIGGNQQRPLAVLKWLSEYKDRDTLPPLQPDGGETHLLLIQGNQGRLAVREYHVLPTLKVMENIQAFYERAQANDGSTYPVKLLAKAFTPNVDPTNRTLTQVLRCVLLGTPLPFPSTYTNSDKIQSTVWRYHLMTEVTDKTNTTHAFRLGRACRIMEIIQWRATGKNNWGDILHGIERRPLKLADYMLKMRHHVKKLQGRYGMSLANEVGEMLEGVDVPNRLTPQQRVQLTLGHAHEGRVRKERAKERAAEKAARENEEDVLGEAAK